jgi:hypothetical protein
LSALLPPVLIAYAIAAFIGLRNSLADIWTNLISFLYRPVPTSTQPAKVEEVRVDQSAWNRVLDEGDTPWGS